MLTWKVTINAGNGWHTFQCNAYTKKAARFEAKRRYPDAKEILIEVA